MRLVCRSAQSPPLSLWLYKSLIPCLNIILIKDVVTSVKAGGLCSLLPHRLCLQSSASWLRGHVFNTCTFIQRHCSCVALHPALTYTHLTHVLTETHHHEHVHHPEKHLHTEYKKLAHSSCILVKGVMYTNEMKEDDVYSTECHVHHYVYIVYHHTQLLRPENQHPFALPGTALLFFHTPPLFSPPPNPIQSSHS